MTLRIALCNEVVRDLSFAAQCDLAARLGYDGLEVAPFTLDAEAPHRLDAPRRAELRRAAADAGIPITSLHWLLVAPAGLSICTDDAALLDRTREVIRGLIVLAAELGARVLVHGSPAQRPVRDAEGAARAEETLRLAGEWSQDAGVTYCLEPLDAGQTSWARTVQEAAGIVRRVASPGLATMIDVSAAGNGEFEPVTDLLDRWLPTGLIRHVHFNDRNRRGPGQGDDRFAPIVAALNRHGYDGWCAVEPFDYVPDGPTAAARAIGYLRGIEESLA
ncbi:sugar phosphate isomerase/epimerase family protein [Roseomonas sp. CCTCC AB2023176]|uniref:sugar phosphate isomerase/epimerase family protein n=1 Tax=Roseomonas sp. CCTCC AB2023176 TaxID=3342640 RepID=UPI0035E041FF